jgi:hypothetical protein
MFKLRFINDQLLRALSLDGDIERHSKSLSDPIQDGSLLSMARKQSYFQAIAGVGYLFAIILASLFFGVAWLSNKGHISAETGVNCIALYWIASVAYFVFGMCSEFRRPYKFFIGRMRLNWRFEWIALVYVVGTLFCSVPLIYFLSVGFHEAISASFKSYSVRGLMGSYGASLFYSMIVMSMIVQIVAARRGMRCFKQASGSTAGHKLAYIKSTKS